MKTTVWIIAFAFVFTACQKKPLTYAISVDATESVIGEVWQAQSDKSYTDLQITDSYYLFADKEADTVLYVYEQKDPTQISMYGLQGNGAGQFCSVEFVKSNTRYPSEKDDVWLVDDKRLLKQVHCQADSLYIIQSILLPSALDRSADYNFTKDEIFGVSTMGYLNSPYYFFNPDSGYYRVDPYGIPLKEYKENRYAYFTNLCVNEKDKVAVSALRFFNSVQFYNLQGEIERVVSIGDAPVMPRNDSGNSLDFENSTKCFIHIYGTEKQVYCLYDGSLELNQLSKIVIFNWNGDHVKTIQTDHMLKKMAVDPSDKYVLALASDGKNGQIVVKYDL